MHSINTHTTPTKKNTILYHINNIQRLPNRVSIGFYIVKLSIRVTKILFTSKIQKITYWTSLKIKKNQSETLHTN